MAGQFGIAAEDRPRMSKTITANSSGYVFASTLASPLTIYANVTVANPAGPAILSTLASYLSIANSGTLAGTAPTTGTVTGGGYGIFLYGSAGISNLAGGHITGGGGVISKGSMALYNGLASVIEAQDFGVVALN